VALDAAGDVCVDLVDAAFSVSDPRGQTSDAGHGHIVDARPARRAGDAGLPSRRVAVIGPSARLADAWSTALAVLGEAPPRFPAGYDVRWM
jgi:thiamine biosynthesis lipoprotein ApbE